MNKITLWYRYNENTREMVYNHYSEGWGVEMQPIPKTEEQLQSWEPARWAKEYSYMEKTTVKHLNEL